MMLTKVQGGNVEFRRMDNYMTKTWTLARFTQKVNKGDVKVKIGVGNFKNIQDIAAESAAGKSSKTARAEESDYYDGYEGYEYADLYEDDSYYEDDAFSDYYDDALFQQGFTAGYEEALRTMLRGRSKA